MKHTITKSEYAYKQAELERIEQEIQNLLQAKAELVEDGADDENPAFGYNQQDLNAALQRKEALRMELTGVTIVEAEQAEEGAFSEHAKSITIKCIFPDEDEPEVETLGIGREGNGCVSPASPLFRFLFGKKSGYCGTFEHNPGNMGTVRYDVEILDIEF